MYIITSGSPGALHFMLQAHVLQLVDPSLRPYDTQILLVSSRLIWSFTKSLVNLFWDCIVLKSKAGSVPTYFSHLSFRGFVDVCSWFTCVLWSCCLKDQVLYITFGSTYVRLYHCVLGELFIFAIFICIVRTGYMLVLSGH